MLMIPKKQFLTCPVDPFKVKFPHGCKSFSENPICFISSKEIMFVSLPESIRNFLIGKSSITFLFW